MAYVTPTGDVQPEEGDVLPLKVAYRDDDPPHIRAFIDQVNPTIDDGEQLAQVVAKVDEMRREYAESQGKDENPAIAAPVDDEKDTKPSLLRKSNE